jgi:hypothetical protein
MAYRASYAKTHLYDEMVTYAEEKSFLENYKHPMIQLDPMKVMLVMSHGDNTFDKTELRNSENPLFKPTTLTLNDFILDDELRAFFESIV